MKGILICLVAISCAPPAWTAPSCATLRANWPRYRAAYHMTATYRDTLECDFGYEHKLAEAIYHLEWPTAEPSFYEWSASRVAALSFRAACSSDAVTNIASRIVFLCDPFFSANPTYRASTLVHEARHTEASDPRHATCARGPDAGVPGACDPFFSTETGGGYGYDVRYLGAVRSQPGQNQLSAWQVQSIINLLVPDRFNVITNAQVSQWRNE